jgi:hypothetical protein
MRGLARLLMSMIDTVSLPGEPTIICPASLSLVFSSLPLMMMCAYAPVANPIAATSAAAPKIVRMVSSLGWFYAGSN